DRRPPGQMSDRLGLEALASQLFGEAVEAGREYAKPAAEKIDPSLSLGSATPQQGNGDAEEAQHRSWLRTTLTTHMHCEFPPVLFLRNPGLTIICKVLKTCGIIATHVGSFGSWHGDSRI